MARLSADGVEILQHAGLDPIMTMPGEGEVGFIAYLSVPSYKKLPKSRTAIRMGSPCGIGDTEEDAVRDLGRRLAKLAGNAMATANAIRDDDPRLERTPRP